MIFIYFASWFLIEDLRIGGFILYTRKNRRNKGFRTLGTNNKNSRINFLFSFGGICTGVVVIR